MVAMRKYEHGDKSACPRNRMKEARFMVPGNKMRIMLWVWV